MVTVCYGHTAPDKRGIRSYQERFIAPASTLFGHAYKPVSALFARHPRRLRNTNRVRNTVTLRQRRLAYDQLSWRPEP